MPDASVQAVQAWLAEHEAELLATYVDLLRIPSLESEPAPNAPFGTENRRALDFMLAKAGEWGFETSELDGYCGWADFGTGKAQVASFGHLDVVPVGPGWKHEPFGAEIEDGYVYARGAIDDKGPTIASFFAMRAIKEVVGDPGVRMRQWFGCNEESGFECIHAYAKAHEAPTFGVAPDSGWPLYHGEKGIANLLLRAPLPTGDFALLCVHGGQRPNIVIDKCEAKVKVAATVRESVASAVREGWDKNLETHWEEDVLHVVAHGKAAHGAWPIGGDNAATRLFRFLREIAPLPSKGAYEELMGVGHIGGDNIGVAGSDEPSGALTANLGIVSTVGNEVELLVNCRYPCTWTGEKLAESCRTKLEDYKHGLKLHQSTDSKPLYFPLDHPLVSTICDVVAQETEEDQKPGVMGGGTYARAISNTVSIGTGWDGDGDAHETDERCAIESLHKMARIYAHIFLRLAKETFSVPGS